MERFFELRMRNGKVFFITTNEDGVCQFSINEVEFCIYTAKDDGKGFTFSVEKDKECGNSLKISPSFEVLSLMEINIRRKTGDKKLFQIVKELKESIKKSKRSFLNWRNNFYSANKGGLYTPDGWIFA